MKQRILSFFLLLLTVQLVAAQAPAGYYNATNGKKGSSLKTALHYIIKDHTACSYSSLPDHFKTTDTHPDGTIWDMYSDLTPTPYARFSGEGGGHNREHSFPKSWFGGKKMPMYTDLFHIYPTDGYINGRRGHYAYGENKGEIYSSHNAFSKVGRCTTPGTTEIAFEPNKEYKGDFARTYFYMVTCYEDKVPTWVYINGEERQGKVPMIDPSTYPSFQKWALDMLLRWAKEDPVSPKEIARNNAVYAIQGNRNPFIDYPGLEQYIWGTMMDTPFDPANYDSDIKPGPAPDPTPVIQAPTFTPSSGVIAAGSTVTLASPTPGAVIHYTLNEGSAQQGPSPVTLTIDATTTISAYAQLGDDISQTVTATFIVKGNDPTSTNVYQLVTDATQLTAGQSLLIVSIDHQTAMAESGSNIRNYADITLTDGLIVTDVNQAQCPRTFLLGGSAGQWTFYDKVESNYLAYTTSGNKLSSTATPTTGAQWTVTIDASGIAMIRNKAQSDRYIQYNASHPRFACYTSNQAAVSLFAPATASSITDVTSGSALFHVFTLDGRHISSDISLEHALMGLTPGLYIINGTKYLIR